MQKLKDAVLLLQKDRKVKVIVALVVLAGVFLMVSKDPRRPMQARDISTAPTSPALAKGEAAEDVVGVFRRELQVNQETMTKMKDKLDKLDENQRALEDQTANIFRKVLEKMQDIDVRQAQTSYPDVQVTEENNTIEGGQAPEPESDLDTMFPQNPVTGPPTQPAKPKIALIGAGDSVRVKLLAGVNAPTDGTPYPVVFQLASDVYGPDGSALPLGEARLIAAAQGSLTDQRALFRLTKLNVRLPSGQRKVFPVDGWVVGEDGIRGMSGVLIDPIGKVIAGESFAASVGAAGEAVAANNTNTVNTGNGSSYSYIDGSVGQFAAGRGIAGGANAWQEIIRQRYESMVPVVQVLSGRDATAVFSGSFEVEDLYNALEDENFQYASLD